jgi:hypothetical protein
MRLHELLEEIDRYGVYGKPAKDRSNADGSKSPLTDPGDASWKRDKHDIFNWFKLPFLTNGPKDAHRLPIKKKKGSG